MLIYNQIQVRQGPSVDWETINPLLLSGEFGFETDTELLKIGNGLQRWNELPYYGASGEDSAVISQMKESLKQKVSAPVGSKICSGYIDFIEIEEGEHFVEFSSPFSEIPGLIPTYINPPAYTGSFGGGIKYAQPDIKEITTTGFIFKKGNYSCNPHRPTKLSWIAIGKE